MCHHLTIEALCHVHELAGMAQNVFPEVHAMYLPKSHDFARITTEKESSGMDL